MTPLFISKPANYQQNRSILFARNEVGQGSLTRIIHERFCWAPIAFLEQWVPGIRYCDKPACGFCGIGERALVW